MTIPSAIRLHAFFCNSIYIIGSAYIQHHSIGTPGLHSTLSRTFFPYLPSAKALNTPRTASLACSSLCSLLIFTTSISGVSSYRHVKPSIPSSLQAMAHLLVHDVIHQGPHERVAFLRGTRLVPLALPEAMCSQVLEDEERRRQG